MECGWDKSKNKEQEEKGNEKPKSGLSSNCRKWGHNDASGWHGKEKQVNRVRSSSSFTLVATDGDKRELGLLESESENAEESLLGLVVGFITINQFSVDFVTSVHVCPKENSATLATLSQSLGYARGGVQRDESARRSVHSESLRCRL